MSRMMAYREWSLPGSYLQRIVLPTEVLVVIRWVTVEIGQVSGLREVLMSHDLAVLRRAWLLEDRWWRERREGGGRRWVVGMILLLVRFR